MLAEICVQIGRKKGCSEGSGQEKRWRGGVQERDGGQRGCEGRRSSRGERRESGACSVWYNEMVQLRRKKADQSTLGHQLAPWPRPQLARQRQAEHTTEQKGAALQKLCGKEAQRAGQKAVRILCEKVAHSRGRSYLPTCDTPMGHACLPVTTGATTKVGSQGMSRPNVVAATGRMRPASSNKASS